jgi:hypothetical protein
LCIRPDLLKRTPLFWVISQWVVVLTQKNTFFSYFMGNAWNHADLFKIGGQLLKLQNITMSSKHQEQTHTMVQCHIPEDWYLQQQCSENQKTSYSLQAVMLQPCAYEVTTVYWLAFSLPTGQFFVLQFAVHLASHVGRLPIFLQPMTRMAVLQLTTLSMRMVK